MTLKWVVLALLVFAPAAARAGDPFASDWAPSLKSRARLIADGAGGAGFQVELSPGAITYWRDPGDAGVAPTFDFAGSENVAHAEIEFPAPTRLAESDGGEAFGYEREVVFPIRVTVADSTRPAALSLSANYAVCEKICLPARAVLRLVLPSGAGSPFADAIARSRARVPRAVDAAALGVDLTARDARDWRLCWAVAAEAPNDLFVEPPPGWWLTTKAEAPTPGRDCFALTLREAPSDAIFPADVRATIVGPSGAVETMLKLSPGR
jgi:DsbC/DsbD-like thiol-disulfide interchange protein